MHAEVNLRPEHLTTSYKDKVLGKSNLSPFSVTNTPGQDANGALTELDEDVDSDSFSEEDLVKPMQVEEV